MQSAPVRFLIGLGYATRSKRLRTTVLGAVARRNEAKESVARVKCFGYGDTHLRRNCPKAKLVDCFSCDKPGNNARNCNNPGNVKGALSAPTAPLEEIAVPSFCV